MAKATRKQFEAVTHATAIHLAPQVSVPDTEQHLIDQVNDALKRVDQMLQEFEASLGSSIARIDALETVTTMHALQSPAESSHELTLLSLRHHLTSLAVAFDQHSGEAYREPSELIEALGLNDEEIAHLIEHWNG